LSKVFLGRNFKRYYLFASCGRKVLPHNFFQQETHSQPTAKPNQPTAMSSDRDESTEVVFSLGACASGADAAADEERDEPPPLEYSDAAAATDVDTTATIMETLVSTYGDINAPLQTQDRGARARPFTKPAVTPISLTQEDARALETSIAARIRVNMPDVERDAALEIAKGIVIEWCYASESQRFSFISCAIGQIVDKRNR